MFAEVSDKPFKKDSPLNHIYIPFDKNPLRGKKKHQRNEVPCAEKLILRKKSILKKHYFINCNVKRPGKR